MAQNNRIDHEREDAVALLDRLRCDPDVVIHRGRSKTPFVSELRVAKGLDVVALLEHSDDEQDDGSGA